MSRIVLFFGCDKTWLELNQCGFHRRNTHMLRALSKQEDVAHTFNIHYVSRRAFFFHKRPSAGFDAYVTDIFVTNYLPGPKFLVDQINLLISKARLKAKLLQYGAIQSVFSWCYLSTSFRHFQSHWNHGKLVVDFDHNQVDAIHAPSDTRLAAIETSAKRATLTISSSRSMNEWIKSRSLGPCQLILNGVDSDRFEILREPGKNDQLRVGYVGSLSKWIDYGAFAEIIRSNPDVQFLLAGKPYQSDGWKMLRNLENVEFVGFLNPHEVPEFLGKLDLTMNLYKRLPGLDVNSMKIYESLASLTPVASLDYHDHIHEDFRGLVKTFSNASELGQSLHCVAALRQDHAWRADVVELLHASTWENRVAQTLNSVSNA